LWAGLEKKEDALVAGKDLSTVMRTQHYDSDSDDSEDEESTDDEGSYTVCVEDEDE
jgi:hypothetical protein